MGIHGTLHCLGETLGVGGQADSQGKRENGGEAQTHVLGILFVELEVRKLHRKRPFFEAGTS
ncbi:hypothetical protein D9M71_743620 [compost metagenome]